MKLVSLVVFALSLWTQAASAQSGDTAAGALELSSPVAPQTREASSGDVSQQVEDAVTLRLELRDVNHQHDAAMALHITSTVLAVVGTGLVAGGVALLFTNWGTSEGAAPALLLTGASHRRKLLAAHPELAFSLTPGPGDAGLGFAVHF